CFLMFLAPGKWNVGGNAGVEPSRRLRRGQCAAGAVDRGGIKRRCRGIRDQRRNEGHAMTDRAPKRAVLIAGPTASGKSAVALALAEALGGTIINADSMQVYGDLRILTARPTAQEEARVPHLLYGHVDAAENYSVGRWCVDASAALAAVERAGRLPVVV